MLEPSDIKVGQEVTVVAAGQEVRGRVMNWTRVSESVEEPWESQGYRRLRQGPSRTTITIELES